jgi:hypothetical protein
MPTWLIIVLALFFGSGFVFWLLDQRGGGHPLYYSDGCPRPMTECALRRDGSRKNIIPQPGDSEIDDLEHLLEHDRR